MQTAWIWHEGYNWFNTGNGSGWLQPGGFVQPGEPFDNPGAKGRFAALVDFSGFGESFNRVRPTPATDEQILRVHDQEYLSRVDALNATGGEAGETTYFGPDGVSIAKLAAGGAIAAVDEVLQGRSKRAYALVRPAGHHAEPDRARGFCVFANTSIAAAHALETHGLDRVAIVDWDVHHGNGTQKVFWEDPRVLTISLHQYGLYPADTGYVEEVGSGEGRGTCLNVPLPAGSGDGAYIHAVQTVVVPALRRFQPDLIIVGSGMDAAALDPLGRMLVTSAGFRGMTREMMGIADEVCDSNLVYVHEGGYSAQYVPFCGIAVLEELSGLGSGVEDPYLPYFSAYPQQALTKAQEIAIGESAANIALVPAATDRPTHAEQLEDVDS